MRLFFPPPFGVGVEGVAWPLPNVFQLVQFVAKCVLGGVLAGAVSQVFLKQADRPRGGRVVEVLRRMLEQLEQEGTVLLGQEAGPSRTVAVAQDLGVVALTVRLDPEVDRARSHPQVLSHAGDGFTLGDFEDGQGAAIDPGIKGLP